MCYREVVSITYSCGHRELRSGLFPVPCRYAYNRTLRRGLGGLSRHAGGNLCPGTWHTVARRTDDENVCQKCANPGAEEPAEEKEEGKDEKNEKDKKDEKDEKDEKGETPLATEHQTKTESDIEYDARTRRYQELDQMRLDYLAQTAAETKASREKKKDALKQKVEQRKQEVQREQQDKLKEVKEKMKQAMGKGKE